MSLTFSPENIKYIILALLERVNKYMKKLLTRLFFLDSTSIVIARLENMARQSIIHIKSIFVKTLRLFKAIKRIFLP